MDNQEIIKAIVKTQLEITPPVKDKINPRFKTAYSSLDAIYSSVRLPLAVNGLTLSHSVDLIDNKYFLMTILRHSSGQEIINKIPMFIENLTSQGFASALTYARRYAICSLLGLPSDEDDDGEATQESIEKPSHGFISREQADEIMKLLDGNDSVLRAILKGYGVNNLISIPSKEFSPICLRLQSFNKNKGKL